MVLGRWVARLISFQAPAGTVRANNRFRRTHRRRTRSRLHRRTHPALRSGDRRDAHHFPHAAQLFRIIRYVGGLDGQRRTKAVAYGVTSLTPARADAPDLAHLLHGHLGAIDNKIHWCGTSPSTRTPLPCTPAPRPKRWRSSATPSSPRSGSPDGATSNRPADTSHTPPADA
jgi:hypothetical protein